MQKLKKVLLFDGVCNLCNGAVQFVLKNDQKKDTLFASLQSEMGQKILKEHQLDTEQFSSIVYYRNQSLLFQSTAVLYLLKDMGGLWAGLFPLIIFPRFIRDFVYDVVAKNRYRWFGKSESCMLPLPEYKERFLD